MRMDGMMMGLAGTLIGASAMSVSGIVKSVADTYLPGAMAKTGHNHQVNVNLQTQRHEAIKHWRAGLAGARDVYRHWEAGPRDKDSPNAVGDEWFEGLRPHLPTTGEAAKFRTAHQVNGDNATLMMLSLEIGRIEKEWVEEARGRPRRGRKRRQ